MTAQDDSNVDEGPGMAAQQPAVGAPPPAPTLLGLSPSGPRSCLREDNTEQSPALHLPLVATEPSVIQPPAPDLPPRHTPLTSLRSSCLGLGQAHGAW